MNRTGSITRTTKETDITLSIVLDGSGKADVQTGNGFLDHMLVLFARHGLFDLTLRCAGDTDVDFHHSAEDIGICLGSALALAIGDHRGIVRYGTFYIPMDESLARVCIDLGGRPNLAYSVELIDRTIQTFEVALVKDFFKAVCDHAGMTIHVDLVRGENSHHAIEAVFKAFARALSCACAINPRASGEVPSTKGVL